MNKDFKVKICVYDDDTLIKYLVQNNIKYNSLLHINNKYFLITNYKNYIKLSHRYRAKIIKYFGIKSIIEFIKFYKYFIITFLFSMFMLFNMCNTIYSIDINCDNDKIKELLNSELEKYDIKLYKRIKSYDEIQLIKDKILNDNKEHLDWLEISNIGTKYIINVTERVINKNKNEIGYNDIVANKDGLIKHIVVKNGSKIKEENEYVKKGDILISGTILKDDKVIDITNASGEVYAETWYISKVSIPFNYVEYKKTGKVINRYYLKLFNHEFTILGKYNNKNAITENSIVLNKPYFFKIYKETINEYKYSNIKINEKEAYDIGIERATNEIDKLLENDEYIISKKTLKKEIKSSKMYLEVFFKVYENIGVTSNILKKEDANEISDN